MILYVNGCSHTAAAEATVPHAFAEDDGMLYHLGRAPHPDNEAISFAAVLSMSLGIERINQSQSGGCNARIIRTTQAWLAQNQARLNDVFVLIQWTTWERQEWLYDNTWWQVNASGTDHVPDALLQRYKQFIIDVDWPACTQQAHRDIWNFHQTLNEMGVQHLFFNANSHFGGLHLVEHLMQPIIPISARHDWNLCYMDPYQLESTYNSVLIRNGFKMVNPKSYHFGIDAHCFWGKFLLQYIIKHQLYST